MDDVDLYPRKARDMDGLSAYSLDFYVGILIGEGRNERKFILEHIFDGAVMERKEKRPSGGLTRRDLVWFGSQRHLLYRLSESSVIMISILYRVEGRWISR